MPISLGTISPFLLFLLFILAYLVIAYREYVLKITRYSADRTQMTNTYLKIINSDSDTPINIEREDEVKIERIENNQDTNDVEDTLIIPPELMNYSFLLNPIRLAIMKVLYEHYRYQSSELRKLLNISWGKYTPHLNNLIRKGYITSEDEFTQDGTPRKILILEDVGRQQYEILEQHLRQLLT